MLPLFSLLVVAAGTLFNLIPFAQANDLFGLAHELPLLFVGAVLFFHGFEELRKKRLMENTPTSKIRSAAMGFAEISGVARVRSPVKAPFSGADCVFFRSLIEREERNSKGGTYWRTVQDRRSPIYFYVDDGTGTILVDPLDAELFLVRDYQTVERPSLLARRTRHSEWYIAPGDYVYVIGTIKKFRDALGDRKERLLAKLRALKEDAEKMKAVDTDHDGQISAEEWDRARAAAEQELLAEEIAKPPDGDDVVIGKGDAEKTFLLADRDERDIGRHLGLKSAGKVLLGAAIVAVIVASLLGRGGLFAVAIPWHAFYR